MPQTNWDDIVENEVLRATARKRGVSYIEKTGWETSRSADEEEGWEVVALMKSASKAGGHKTKLRKAKPFYDAFEDEVWTMFHKMGFYRLNKSRKFTIYDPDGNYNQQIDVFAADDDVVLIIECKSSDTKKKASFKHDIDALGTHREEIQKALRKNEKYADKKLAFIWATKNITLNKEDRNRLENYGISYFNDDTVQYYTQLVSHLGGAARYQLLGDIFRGKSIKGMDMRIPAIQGKMGGMTYYVFSIEPEKLLKIGYVLHHSLAVSGSMATYQRVIKKNRLTEIRNFLDKQGGYFPNSLLISLDTPKGRPLQFDIASCPVNSPNSRIGTLHLPQQYHSAYIIDGQHRLYGYSDSEYADKNTIPVVAFENLDGETQMKLFMDINENQKAVPKQLRVILSGDLYWNDEKKSRQRDALRSKIAQQLGTDMDSPLKGRIILSEGDKTTDFCCVTVEAVQSAINNCNFLTTYNAQNARVGAPGTFDCEDLTQTFNLLYPFLCDELGYISEKCEAEWEAGAKGILSINRGVYGCIRLISDITDMLASENKINPLSDDLSKVEGEVERYLECFTNHVNQMTVDQKSELLKYRGSGGTKQFWRRFQNIIHDEFPNEFNPDGLAEFNENETQKYNSASREYITAIEKTLRLFIKKKLQERYPSPSNWLMQGVPVDVYQRINTEAMNKNYLIGIGAESGENVEPWDFVSLDDLRSITVYGRQWSELFSESMVRPEERNSPGDKTVKTQWMADIQKERNGLFGNMSATYSVKKSQFDIIESVYKWLCIN